jgi:hypothetical protein
VDAMMYEGLPEADLQVLREEFVSRSPQFGRRRIACALTAPNHSEVLDIALRAMAFDDEDTIANALEAIEHACWFGSRPEPPLAAINTALTTVHRKHAKSDFVIENLNSLCRILNELAEKNRLAKKHRVDLERFQIVPATAPE